MTTTVTVKARAWGAMVEVNGDLVKMQPNTEQNFHVEEGESSQFKVTHGEKPAENAQEMPLDPENVPGRAENDRILGKDANKSGASETTMAQEETDAGPKAKR